MTGVQTCALPISALPVDPLAVPDVEQARLVGLDGRVEAAQRAGRGRGGGRCLLHDRIVALPARYRGGVTRPIVTLATCSDYSDLDDDDRGLPDALRERGIEPRVAVWDDPAVDWDDAGVVVLRSVRDYAKRGNYDKFLAWARSVPRLANHPDVVEWNY